MAVQRGKKSAESQSVALLERDSAISHETRLAPPLHLSDLVRAEWLAVVNDQPASAFSAIHVPMLEMYCKHVVKARMFDDEIECSDKTWLADDDGLKRMDKLTQLAERESRAASSLATRLRITRQAIERPENLGRAANKRAKSRKPWELALDSE